MKTNVPDPDLRQTGVTTRVAPRELRRAFDPVRLFVDMNLAARFWFALFALLVVAWTIEHVVTLSAQTGDVILLDGSGTVINTRLVPFADAKALHMQQATLATHAFLNRTPLDFDNRDLLQLMYLPHAFAKVALQFAEEGPERSAKQIHQKAEIGEINLLETREDLFLFKVTGQLVRSGVFQEQAFAESLPFKFRLTMLRNPSLSLNGRFPMAVKEFSYEPAR